MLTSPGCTASRSTRSHTRSNSRRRLTSRRRCGVSRITTVNARAAPPRDRAPSPAHWYRRSPHVPWTLSVPSVTSRYYSSSFMLRPQHTSHIRTINRLLAINKPTFRLAIKTDLLWSFFVLIWHICLAQWIFVFLLFLNLTFTLTASVWSVNSGSLAYIGSSMCRVSASSPPARRTRREYPGVWSVSITCKQTV